MSHLQDVLHSFYNKCYHINAGNYKTVLVVTVCTVSAITLTFSAEEEFVRGAAVKVEAKGNEANIVLLEENTTSLTSDNLSSDILVLGPDTCLSDYTIQLVQQKKEEQDRIDKALEAEKEIKTEKTMLMANQVEEMAKQKAEEAKKAAEEAKKAAEEKAAAEKKAAEEKAAKKKSSSKKITLSKSERQILERIVQAEAGNQDIKGRMLVANVVLNRVKSKSFPNTVKGVVFQHKGSSYQFSPAKSGSVNRVKVTEKTKKAVDRVLNGEDYSEGALYFVARKIANKNSLSWFDRKLTRLFTHGGHTFYK